MSLRSVSFIEEVMRIVTPYLGTEMARKQCAIEEFALNIRNWGVGGANTALLLKSPIGALMRICTIYRKSNQLIFLDKISK